MSSITGNINKALLNNNFYFNKVVWGLRNRAATWRAITGYKEQGVLDPVTQRLKIGGIEDVSGFEGAIQFNMALATFDKVDDTESELDVVTGEYIEDVEEFSWKMCHYARTHFISDKRRKMNMGQVKTDNLMDVCMATNSRGLVKQMNQEFFADTDQTSTSIGGLQKIIDDDNTYGYNRANSKYADLRSYVASGATLTNEKIALARTSVVDMGGQSEVAVAGATVYNYVEYLCAQRVSVQVKTDEKWAGFGGQILHYGNTVFSLDTDCPAQKMFGLSIESEEGMKHWMVRKNESPMVGDDFVMARERRGHPWALPIDVYIWVGCATPGAQWRLDSITAPSGYSA